MLMIPNIPTPTFPRNAKITSHALTCVLSLAPLHHRRCPVDVLRLDRWLQDVAILGHHQHGDKVDDGQRQELGLLRLLLKHPFLIKYKIPVLVSNTGHILAEWCNPKGPWCAMSHRVCTSH